MDITIENAGPYCRVRLSERLDRKSAADAYDTFVELGLASDQDVVIVADRLEKVTRAGSRGIFVAAKLLQRRGRRMFISGASPSVVGILAGAGHDSIIQFVTDECELMLRKRKSVSALHRDRAADRLAPGHLRVNGSGLLGYAH